MIDSQAHVQLQVQVYVRVKIKIMQKYAKKKYK